MTKGEFRKQAQLKMRFWIDGIKPIHTKEEVAAMKKASDVAIDWAAEIIIEEAERWHLSPFITKGYDPVETLIEHLKNFTWSKE